ncbi:DUF4870 domain-containing protein [Chitinophaga costaii]|nr:DUF4870 domain-containing protein [Chitinophaga costaii]
MLVHLGGLIGMCVISLAGNIIGALVFWLIKRNESAFVDDQGREAVNFQITISILSLVLSAVSWIFFTLLRAATWSWMWGYSDFGPVFFHPRFFHFGWAGLSGLAWVLNIIFSIIAAVRANNGIAYRYPISLRLVK